MMAVLRIIIFVMFVFVAGIVGAHAVCGIADWIYDELIKESKQ